MESRLARFGEVVKLHCAMAAGAPVRR